MIDVEIAREALGTGRDGESVQVTRRCLRQMLFEIENGQKAAQRLLALQNSADPPQLDYDPFSRLTMRPAA